MLPTVALPPATPSTAQVAVGEPCGTVAVYCSVIAGVIAYWAGVTSRPVYAAAVLEYGPRLPAASVDCTVKVCEVSDSPV